MGVYKQWQVYWFSVTHKGKRYRKKTPATSEDEALYYENLFRESIGAPIKKSSLYNVKSEKREIRLQAACQRMLAETSATNGLKNIQSVLNSLRAFYGDEKLLQYVADNIHEIIRYWKNTLATNTIRVYITVLRAFFRSALNDWKAIDCLPNIKRPKAVQTQIKVYSKEEERVIKSFFKENESMLDLVSLAFGTGARLGELLSLKCKDFDIAQRSITLWFTKNGKHRGIPLNKSMFEIVKKRCTNTSEALFSFDDQHVFYQWRQLRKKTSIEGTFHKIRHTVATRLIIAGMPLAEVARLLGHSTTKMTEIYTQIQLTDLRGLVDSLEEK